MKLTSKLTYCLYSSATFMAAPAGLLYLRHKKRKDPPYGTRAGELLGLYDFGLETCVWFHTVSVGEVIAARPLISRFIHRHPKLTVLVTTTTTTGAAEARRIEGCAHVFAPLDSPAAVRRFLCAFNPSHLFIMETELWPCMLNEAHRFGTRVCVFNARMPEKTCLKYLRFPRTVKDLIADPLDMVIAQSKADAERFARIGVDRDRIFVSNSLKYDMHPNEQLFRVSRLIKRRRLKDCIVLGALSTHEGEENQLLETFFNLRSTYKNLRLVLVPRHNSGVSRAEEFLVTCDEAFALRTDLRSDLSDFNCDVLIGNTMGEMEFYMGLCDMVFMGGSFVDVGGHNPLEPAFFSLPVMTGPYYYNFQEQYDRLIDRGGAFLANDNRRLYTLCKKFLSDPKLIAATGIRAMDVQQEGRGALERTLSCMESILTEVGGA